MIGDTLARLRNTLTMIARQQDLTIIAARDIGSHAWELAGPASDYDVRVLFAQEPLAYATLGEYCPSINETRETIELTGWNVTRFGELLTESNPTALEFLHSPVRYREHDALAALEAAVGDDFVPIDLYHHYRSLAENNYQTAIQRRLLERGEPIGVIEDETPEMYIVRPNDAETTKRLPKADDRYTEAATDRTVKRNLYVIRAVLYARYIRETHAFPELSFPAFLDANAERFATSLVSQTRTLIERKQRGEGNAVVGDVFGEDALALPQQIDSATHNVRGIDRDRVNAFIRTTVTEAMQ
ncbi:nucleotidyltransferase domain-containing protein [Halocatena marina]|uniref:Nucleotidyltransferase domain-containing protein n=1 Tax=Halocatena marina TaxID=2934937 RepID=A0ABD5YUS8_9EURY|nr:nucleotidyltransferase domain-containing protein [Halocatena marina]